MQQIATCNKWPNNNSTLIKLHSHNCSLPNCNYPIINESPEVKYLGIIIDKPLKWDKHIKHLCSKLRKIMYNFIQMRNYLTINTLRIIYFALFQSVIQYRILGWGCVSNTNLTPLNLLQKKIIKICLRKPIDYPTDQLFKEFKVFNIRQIYLNVLLKFMHKNLNFFKQYSHNYSTKGLDTVRLFEPKCIRTTAFNHSSIVGPRLYKKFITKYPE